MSKYMASVQSVICYSLNMKKISYYEDIHQHVYGNKKEIDDSTMCICINCGKRYKANLVKDFKLEDDYNVTAICPYCDEFTVLGDSSGYELEDDEVSRIKNIWM